MAATFLNPVAAENAPRLLEYLSRAIGGRVEKLNEPPRRLAGGSENRNYLCSVRVDGHDHTWVLRCEPDSIPEWRRDWGLYDLEREFRVLQELPALNLGLPAPTAFGFSDALGVPSFVMEYLPGTPLAHEYTPSHEKILPAYARAVATVSTIAVAPGSWLSANLVRRTLDRDLAWCAEKSRSFRAEPLHEYSQSWLREHRPPSRPLVMSHGDPNPGNCLADEGRITGIVDWEFACLTDDSLSSLLRVTWLYQAEALRPIFCQAMQRDVRDLTWHLALSLFQAVYVFPSPQRPQHSALLASMVGY